MENEKFTRVVLGFNEAGFEQQAALISRFCDDANNAVAEIKIEYDLPLTDAEIKAMFLDLDSNPNGLIEKHFSSQKSKVLRDESITDLKDFVNEILFDFRQFDSSTRKAIYVKRGKLLVDPAELQKIKQSFETSLDTPRAVDLYNRHQEIFKNYCELLEVTGNAPSVRSLWYEDLNQGKMRIKELNYNNL